MVAKNDDGCVVSAICDEWSTYVRWLTFFFHANCGTLVPMMDYDVVYQHRCSAYQEYLVPGTSTGNPASWYTGSTGTDVLY